MKYFSMFSGIGGFELGIQNAYRSQNGGKETLTEVRDSTTATDDVSATQRSTGEYDYNRRCEEPACIGYSEIDKYAIKVYERHFKHENRGNATTIKPSGLPDFDLLVGGFPCQAFSIAGKRAGFNDTRGTLFFDIARILKDKRPRHLVLENVKGLLSHDGGKTFRTILGVLSDLGYRVEWQVLNSKWYVPQNRERIYIVGHLRGGCASQVFPIEENDLATDEGFEGGVEQVASTLKSRDYAGWRGNFVKQLNQPKHSNERVYGEDGLSPTLNTMQGGLRQPFVAPVLTPDRPEKRQKGRRFKENGEPSFTLTSQDKHGIYDGSKIRRLTPVECERLQGFPDNWTLEGTDGIISDTQRYKMCGNAVTVNVVEAVVERLKPCLA